MTKNEYRNKYTDIRNNIKNKYEKDEEIFNLLINSKFYTESESIFIYNSFRSEVNTKKIIEHAKEEKMIALPKVKDEIVFYKYGGEEFSVSSFGIMEIENDYIVKPDKKSIIIVPGIAFSKEFYRIGYGKGYYDRYLAHCPDVIKIGLCYHEQIIDSFAYDTYDIKMDMILTERGFMK